MAHVSLFLISFLSYPLLLHSADERKFLSKCPPFACGKLGEISFPFSDTSHPECGLCQVNNCNKPVQKIQLQKGGNWYEVKNISQASSIFIDDHELQRQLNSSNCGAFNYFTLPSFPYFSFKITPNITLFKCNRTLNTTFHADFNYTGCKDYNIYYNHLNNSPPILPSQCSVIQLPVIENPREADYNDLFTLMRSDFNIETHVSGACYSCYGRGGQCQRDTMGRFRCAGAKLGKNKLPLKLAIAASVAGIGVLIVVVSYYWIRSSSNKSVVFWKKKNQNLQNVEAILKNYGSLAPKRYSYSEVKKMTNFFKNKLGQGGYGGVYKGKLHDGRHVAVKVLNESKGNGEEFVNEVASISQTSHVNIVTLLGFCFEGPKRALIYEFMTNGSLERFIYDKNSSETDRQLGWDTLYQIALGIARGLDYLHRGCNTKIFHFDIKPHNILLDEEFCPKISDFGLAKLCSRKESTVSMLGARGTIGYIAPEVVCRNFGGVSHKSDVYSYGMMVLEMVGGRKNVHPAVDRTSEIYFPHWIYKRIELGEELGLQGIMNEEEKEKARKMIIIGLWCIQTDPSSRPPMYRVMEMLQGSLESLQIPPTPFLCSPPGSLAESSTAPIITL